MGSQGPMVPMTNRLGSFTALTVPCVINVSTWGPAKYSAEDSTACVPPSMLATPFHKQNMQRLISNGGIDGLVTTGFLIRGSQVRLALRLISQMVFAPH